MRMCSPHKILLKSSENSFLNLGATVGRIVKVCKNCWGGKKTPLLSPQNQTRQIMKRIGIYIFAQTERKQLLAAVKL